MQSLNIKLNYVNYSSSSPNITKYKRHHISLSPKPKHTPKKYFHHPQPIFTIREQYFTHKHKNANTNILYLKKIKLNNISKEINKTLKTFLFQNLSPTHNKKLLPSVAAVHHQHRHTRNPMQSDVNIHLSRNKTINNKVGVDAQRSKVFKHIYEMKSITNAIGNKYLKAALEKENKRNIKQFLSISPSQTKEPLSPKNIHNRRYVI
jgi:hypothetical protein